MNPVLRLFALIALVVVLIWSVAKPRRHTPKPLSDFQVVEEWLHCIDCRGSFIERMRNIPPSRRDSIARFLNAALLNGPDGARIARLNQDLARAWLDDSLYRAAHGIPAHKLPGVFMTRFRRGFEVMWRSRAATALGIIRTPFALAALNDALQLPQQDKGDTMIHRMVQRAQADSGRTGGEPPHP